MEPDASFQNAKRLYLESCGDPMVTNTYLKIALVLVSLVAVGLALVDLRTIRTFQNFRPLVIRIDDLGRAEAINYHNLEYKPQDAEAKYFLSQFCALYYRRNRYTIQDDFSKSLYFLDGKLADGILDAYRKDDIIKKFITNSAAPEIDVDVKKVALEEMQTPPFRARVDFYMVYYSPADHSELKRDLYTANFVFLFKSQVPERIDSNQPLGLPSRTSVKIRLSNEKVQSQSKTEEVANGRSRNVGPTSARHRRPDPCALSSRWPRPDSRVFAVRTNGAPQEGLLFAPLSVRSPKPQKAGWENRSPSRGIQDDRERTSVHDRSVARLRLLAPRSIEVHGRLQGCSVPTLTEQRL